MELEQFKTETIEKAVSIAKAGGAEPSYTKQWLELYKPWDNLFQVKPDPHEAAVFLLKLMLRKK